MATSMEMLWITLPIGLLAALLAFCLVLPVILHRYCKECMAQDACCGIYYGMFENMMGGSGDRRPQQPVSQTPDPYAAGRQQALQPYHFYEPQMTKQPPPMQQPIHYAPPPQQQPQQQQQQWYAGGPSGVAHQQDSRHNYVLDASNQHSSVKAVGQVHTSVRKASFGSPTPYVDPADVSLFNGAAQQQQPQPGAQFYYSNYERTHQQQFVVMPQQQQQQQHPQQPYYNYSQPNM